MDIIMNQIAIWRAKAIDSFAITPQPAGLRALNPVAKTYYNLDSPFFRYAKNYTVGKSKSAVKYCLFVRTTSSDARTVESRLDEVAKTVTVMQARDIINRADYNDFEYLDARLEVE